MAACWDLAPDLRAATTTAYMQEQVHTGESLRWAGSDKFGEALLLALLSASERRYQTWPTPALYFQRLWVISVVIWSYPASESFTDQLHIIQSTVVLSEIFNQLKMNKLIFVVVFFCLCGVFCLLVCFSGSSQIKYWTNETNVEFDQWHHQDLCFNPFFFFPSSVMQTDQTVF